GPDFLLQAARPLDRGRGEHDRQWVLQAGIPEPADGVRGRSAEAARREPGGERGVKCLMSDEKTLDEALDEIDRWGDDVARAIESLTTEQVVEYFRQAQFRLEQQIGKQLDLTGREKPRTSVA